MQVHTLENRRLENFLERHKAYYAYTGEIEIDRFLRQQGVAVEIELAFDNIESIKKAAEIAVRAAEEGNEITAVVASIGKTSDQLRSIAINGTGWK